MKKEKHLVQTLSAKTQLCWGGGGGGWGGGGGGGGGPATMASFKKKLRKRQGDDKLREPTLADPGR